MKRMHRWSLAMGVLLGFATYAFAATRPHVVVFGKRMPVKFFLGPDQTKELEMKVRALIVDGSVKEFTTGDLHDITERLFVVRRAYRINDWLPEDAKNVRWQWQRGGWLMVDRQTGRISQVKLPSFDSYYSTSSWYRDYVAYCGLSDDRSAVYAMVVQLGSTKPILKKEIGSAKGAALPESECATPVWQRQPARVTFTRGEQVVTYAVRGRAADIATDDSESASEEETQ